MLKRVCEPVDEASALGVAQDLVDTMRAHPGCVGLAASQIGEPIRVCVVDVSAHRMTTSSSGLLLLLSPRIIDADGSHIAREGCLSLPDITADVRRHERIQLQGYRGTGAALWSAAFEARAIQHELDHLDGILILDRAAGAHAVYPRRAPG
jgi:peptide deformylase